MAESADSEAGETAWAWLGDMEMDDTLLGLGAAGIFKAAAPRAIGFLVNFVHCAEKTSEGKVRMSAMYSEKRTFLDTFFGGAFFAVLDRFSRDKVTADDLQALPVVCGLEDELEKWAAAVVAGRPLGTLHLLLSGPLLGRGEELCKFLDERLLVTAEAGFPEPRIVIWSYAGSFNIRNSSPADFAALQGLLDGPKAARVTFMETSLKPGSWVCKPPCCFWSTACRPDWSLEDAKNNLIGFDVSCDLDGVNSFLEEMSSRASGEVAAKRGLKWVFGQIVANLEADTSESAKQTVLQLLQELEMRSLVTDLKVMVPPGSSSMAMVREALPVEQAVLNEAHAAAMDAAAKLSTEDGFSAGAGLVDELRAAAKAYAELYRGVDGQFLEAGCTEFFPPGKPCNGPRTDKRCILRCMAEGRLQGGPTADILVVLALLLYIDAAERPAGHTPVPDGTKALFQLERSTGAGQAFSVCLLPSVKMDIATKLALQPLVDELLVVIVRGAVALLDSAAHATWGKPHRR